MNCRLEDLLPFVFAIGVPVAIIIGGLSAALGYCNGRLEEIDGPETEDDSE